MKKIPILNFPRLLNLEKRISGPTELSVEEIKNLEKRLISSIQEISSSLEKEETKYPKKFKEKENFNELEEKDLIINDENSLVYNKQINVENINTNHNCNNTVNDVKNEVITVEKLELNQKLIENPENENCEKLPETLERNPELPISKPNELYTKSPYKISEQTLEIKPLLEIKEKKTNTIEIKRSSKQSVPKRKLEDSSKQAFLDEYFTEKPTQNNENSQGLSIKAKVNKFKEVNINLKSPISPIQTPTITFSGVKVKELEDYEKELKILREKLNEKERESKEKERLLERLTEEKAKYKEKHDSFIEDFESYKYQVQKLLSNYLLECERYKKNEIKTHLSSQRHRLGEYINQRNGSKFEDIWVDGYELRNLKEMLNKISNDKEELKEKKKKLKKGVDDSNEKEIISQRIKILSNEEEVLKSKLEKLNEEIFDFVAEYKKQYEEDHSKYGKPNQTEGKPLWPILENRYQLLSLIGKGGFSEVYKAFDLDEFHFVACKIHELNPIWSENLKQNYIKHANREIEIHKSLNHINIVKLCDIVEINPNSFCTVLEYCEGPDLGYHLKQHKALPEKEARLILKQIVQGVKYLNQYTPKIIHYDLKPQNILFHKGLIKISDFGLCKILDEDSTKMELTSQGMGTYWYLPPECFQSNNVGDNLISPKVDVWSIGVIFYEMLYGVKPFGNAMSQEKLMQEKIILKANTVNFPQSPNASSEAKELITKCLEYDQFKRPDIVTLATLNYLSKK